MQENRRQFLKKCAAVGAGGVFFSNRTLELRAGARRPNIIYILTDDLGYGDLGSYGQKLIKTPSLDKMATEGMRFTDHYSGTCICAPARCVLLTGLHTGHSFIRDNYELNGYQLALPLETVTVSKLLKEAGYTCGCIGKWGLGGPDSTGHPNENTLIFFTSDNGPHGSGGTLTLFDANGPLRGKKRDLYEGGVRVPLIARWPGRIRPGSVTAHISAFWDFLPTCCELAGIDIPAGIDGISFLPTLFSRPERQVRHEYLYWEFKSKGGKQALRMGRFKGVRLNVRTDADAPLELYDLDSDIGETVDIAAGHPEIVAQITGFMQQAHTRSQYFPFLPHE